MKERLKLAYLSGPMRGLQGLNFSLFDRVAANWERKGYVILNPASNFGGNSDLHIREYLRRDLIQVLESDFLVMLPDWQLSDGATLELSVATAAGIPYLEHSLADGVPHCEDTLRALLHS